MGRQDAQQAVTTQVSQNCDRGTNRTDEKLQLAVSENNTDVKPVLVPEMLIEPGV